MAWTEGGVGVGRKLAIPLASSLLACGGSLASPAPSPDAGGDVAAGASEAGTASSWVADLTAAYCTWAVRCGRFRDVAGCEAFTAPEYAAVNFDQATAAVTAVADGKAHFDPTQAASCLSTLSNLGCDVDFVNPPHMPAACMTTFYGSTSDGGACIDDVECAHGSMCVVVSTETCAGTCTPASGGTCRMDDDCPPQQFCAAALMEGPGLWGSGVCEAILPTGTKAGDLCGMPVPCAPGLSCAGGPPPARCVASAMEGASCNGFVLSCAQGLACVSADDGTTSTCMPPAKLGDACTSLFQCGAQYTLSDILCDEKGTHTCVKMPSAGPCVVVSHVNTCDPTTSYCESGTCKPWLSQGAPCVVPSDGIDPCGLWNSCQNSVCAPLLGTCTPQ
jgi:hypothetical protein